MCIGLYNYIQTYIYIYLYVCIYSPTLSCILAVFKWHFTIPMLTMAVQVPSCLY